jgi:hypothetical protein
MSGCYQCGLSEGSETRLCETCYRNRFYRDLVVAQPAREDDSPCVEISPRMQHWLVSGGAALCVGILGLTLLAQSHSGHLSASALQKEFVRTESGYVPVSHERHFGVLSAPASTKS